MNEDVHPDGITVRARVLATPPVSGSVEEVRFDARGTCTWVEFDTSGGRWCGIFRQGAVGPDAVVAGDDGAVFVLARGRGYLVDPVGKRALFVDDRDCFRAVVAIPGTGFFVAADDVCLYAFSRQGRIWTSPRVSMDGIDRLTADSRTVRGRLEMENGRGAEFTLTVGSWKFDCPWKCPFE